MSSFQIKQGDTLPILKMVLDQDSRGVNLTDCTVSLELSRNGVSVLVAPCTVVNPTLGEIEYAWAPEDTAQAGTLKGEVTVTYLDGSQLTVPTIGDFEVVIGERVA